MVNKGNHPKLALFQVSELLSYPHIYIYVYIYIYIIIYYHNDMFAIVDCLEGIYDCPCFFDDPNLGNCSCPAWSSRCFWGCICAIVNSWFIFPQNDIFISSSGVDEPMSGNRIPDCGMTRVLCIHPRTKKTWHCVGFGLSKCQGRHVWGKGNDQI